MHCHDFLDHYSDYRDGTVVDSAVRSRLRQHLLECPDCERHDRVLRAGLRVLRAGDAFGECPDLTGRIEARIRSNRARDLPNLPRGTGIAAAVMLALGLALIGASVFKKRSTTLADLPPLEAVPYPQVLANPGVPFVTFQDPRAGVILGTGTDYSSPPQRPVVAPLNYR